MARRHVQGPRRVLNRLVTHLRHGAAPPAIAADTGLVLLPPGREAEALEALAHPLIDPEHFDPLAICVYCGHPLGGHTGIGGPCGFSQCRCQLFIVPKGERPMEPTEHPDDPFAGMEEPPDDPFADVPEPPEPPDDDDDAQGDPEAPKTPGKSGLMGLQGMPVTFSPTGPASARVPPRSLETLSRPVGAPESDDLPEPAETPVLFPVLLQGQAGVRIDALAEPARRVAEIVEALEPVLLPPPVVEGLEDLLTKAAAVRQVTNAEEYRVACELYELLAVNEKGLEQTVGPVRAFFHRPWKTVCNFIAKYQPRIEFEKQRLSPLAGAWRKAEDARAEHEAREKAAAAAAEERRQLEEDAERARAVAAQTAIEQGPEAPEAAKMTHVAEILEHAATQVLPVPMPVLSRVPAATGTKGKTKWVGEIADENLFFKGLADGTIPRWVFLEKAQGALDRQAGDLKGELEKRYPGLKAVEVPGIAAKGRR